MANLLRRLETTDAHGIFETCAETSKTIEHFLVKGRQQHTSKEDSRQAKHPIEKSNSPPPPLMVPSSHTTEGPEEPIEGLVERLKDLSTREGPRPEAIGTEDIHEEACQHVASPMSQLEHVAQGSLSFCLSPEPRSALMSPLLNIAAAAQQSRLSTDGGPAKPEDQQHEPSGWKVIAKPAGLAMADGPKSAAGKYQYIRQELLMPMPVIDDSWREDSSATTTAGSHEPVCYGPNSTLFAPYNVAAAAARRNRSISAGDLLASEFDEPVKFERNYGSCWNSTGSFYYANMGTGNALTDMSTSDLSNRNKAVGSPDLKVVAPTGQEQLLDPLFTPRDDTDDADGRYSDEKKRTRALSDFELRSFGSSRFFDERKQGDSQKTNDDLVAASSPPSRQAPPPMMAQVGAWRPFYTGKKDAKFLREFGVHQTRKAGDRHCDAVTSSRPTSFSGRSHGHPSDLYHGGGGGYSSSSFTPSPSRRYGNSKSSYGGASALAAGHLQGQQALSGPPLSYGVDHRRELEYYGRAGVSHGQGYAASVPPEHFFGETLYANADSYGASADDVLSAVEYASSRDFTPLSIVYNGNSNGNGNGNGSNGFASSTTGSHASHGLQHVHAYNSGGSTNSAVLFEGDPEAATYSPSPFYGHLDYDNYGTGYPSTFSTPGINPFSEPAVANAAAYGTTNATRLRSYSDASHTSLFDVPTTSKRMMQEYGKLANVDASNIYGGAVVPPSAGYKGQAGVKMTTTTSTLKPASLGGDQYKGPLYIVEFKAGRSEVFYYPSAVSASTEAQGSPGLELGSWVIVEADRGEDCGFISGIVTLEWLKSQMTYLQSMNMQNVLHSDSNVVDGSPALKGVGVGPGTTTKPTTPSPKSSTTASSPEPPGSTKTVHAGCYFHDRSLLGSAPSIPVFLSCKELVPKRIHRKATPNDLMRLQAKDQEEALSILRCTARLANRNLGMEIVDAEYQWDRNKLTFYYNSKERVDFRELVKELFRIYKTRIWMCAMDRKIPIQF